jgi:hypothetical protein
MEKYRHAILRPSVSTFITMQNRSAKNKKKLDEDTVSAQLLLSERRRGRNQSKKKRKIVKEIKEIEAKASEIRRKGYMEQIQTQFKESANGGSKKQYKSNSTRTRKLKKRRTAGKRGSKRRIIGGGPSFSKSKPQYIIENNTGNKEKEGENPKNTVRFNPISRKRKSYTDKYDIDNISDNSEEEEIGDKSIKRKRKNGKKWPTKCINKSHRSVDLRNRIILNKFKKTMDDENLINWTTGKITREEYDATEEEIKKQTKIGGMKNQTIKTTRKKGSK